MLEVMLKGMLKNVLDVMLILREVVPDVMLKLCGLRLREGILRLPPLEKRAGKFMLMLIRGRAEGLLCTGPGARTPIVMSRNSFLLFGRLAGFLKF
jgi:hypothetical protein